MSDEAFEVREARERAVSDEMRDLEVGERWSASGEDRLKVMVA